MDSAEGKVFYPLSRTQACMFFKYTQLFTTLFCSNTPLVCIGWQLDGKLATFYSSSFRQVAKLKKVKKLKKVELW